MCHFGGEWTSAKLIENNLHWWQCLPGWCCFCLREHSGGCKTSPHKHLQPMRLWQEGILPLLCNRWVNGDFWCSCCCNLMGEYQLTCWASSSQPNVFVPSDYCHCPGEFWGKLSLLQYTNIYIQMTHNFMDTLWGYIRGQIWGSSQTHRRLMPLSAG